MATRKAPKSPKSAVSAKRSPRPSAPKTGSTGGSRKTAPKPAPAPEASRRGPSEETIAFAAEVVRLRDEEGMAWKAVAERLGVGYDHNGSSRLRRAYTLGAGRTVGVRAKRAEEAAKVVAESKAKTPAKSKRTRKTAAPSKGAKTRETAAERRARLGRESAASGAKARTPRTSRAKAARVA